MKRIWIPIALLACAASVGCVAGGAGGGVASSNRDLITSEELRSYEGTYDNLYRLIQARRSSWLRPRATASFSSSEPELPRVVLDGSPYGEVGALRSVSLSDAQEVRFLDSRDATTRFGTGYTGGAILVTTR